MIVKIKSLTLILPEIQQQRKLLWSITHFALGILIYLKLPTEPPIYSAAIAIAILLALLPLCKNYRFHSLTLICLLPMAIGFAHMQIHNYNIFNQKPTENLKGSFDITATVKNWDDRGKKHYLTLKIHRLSNVSVQQAFNARIRIYDSQMPSEGIGLGDQITIFAKISPPKPAQTENGFSARKYFWGQNIHYSGFALGDVKIIKPYRFNGTITSQQEILPNIMSHASAVVDDLRYRIFQWRHHVADNIRATIQGDEGEVAAALLTGLRGRINKEIAENMRYSGLAHLLAISGLHMGCAALSVFFLTRLLLCLYSPWALRYPLKKIAAATAMTTAFIYLLLAGDSISAERAWIMVSLALLAILIDRRVFNMRTVAIAALVILILKPYQITSVGFQLSFLAVIALTAGFEWYNRRRKFRTSDHHLAMRGFLSLTAPLKAAALTTLIAGFATTPAISHYFGYVAPWSLLSNLLAVPLTALVIIPSGFIGLALMPIGAHAMPLTVMGEAIAILLNIADFTRHLPAGEWHPRHFGGTAYAVFVGGFLWLCLWQGKVRLFGVPLIVAAFVLWGSAVKPTAIIQGGKRVFAVASPEGDYDVYGGRLGDYRVRRWRQYYGLGDMRKLSENADLPHVVCDESACRIGDKFKIILSFERSKIAEHCAAADFVVAYYNRADFGTCRENAVGFINYRDLKERGALFVYDDRLRFAVPENGRLWQLCHDCRTLAKKPAKKPLKKLVRR